MQDFRRLVVWNKAHAMALDVHGVTRRIRRRDGLALGAQLRRSVLSIPANIAEGAGKASEAEFYRFIQIALGSASETMYHLLLARDMGLLSAREHDALLARLVEIRKMLTGLARRIKVSIDSPVADNPSRIAPPSAPDNARSSILQFKPRTPTDD